MILLSLEPLLLLLMLLSPAEVMLQDGAKRSVYHRVWGKLHLPTHVRASPSVSQREHRRGQRDRSGLGRGSHEQRHVAGILAVL